MGVSRITDPGAAALFLSQVCPLGCEIEYGVTWQYEYDGSPFAGMHGALNLNLNVGAGVAGGDGVEGPTTTASQLMADVTKRCDGWKEVEKMLPLLTRLRMEERARTRTLMDEVDDLRVRNRILLESAGISGGAHKNGTCVVV